MDVKYGRFARHALYARGDEQAKLIDQPGLEQDTIGCATALQQEATYPQFMVQRHQRRREVDLPLSGKDVGDAVLTQPREGAFGRRRRAKGRLIFVRAVLTKIHNLPYQFT